jgi:hypothetical protein
MAAVLAQFRLEENPPRGWKFRLEVIFDPVDGAHQILCATMRLEFRLNGHNEIVSPFQHDETNNAFYIGSLL